MASLLVELCPMASKTVDETEFRESEPPAWREYVAGSGKVENRLAQLTEGGGRNSVVFFIVAAVKM